MKFKRLIPALAMLLVSAILLGTSTFAWFSMNTEVSATNMKVQIVADQGILINEVAAATDSNWDNTATTSQSEGIKLHATSTANTVAWYVAHSKVSGDAAAATAGDDSDNLTSDGYQSLGTAPYATAIETVAAVPGSNAKQDITYVNSNGTAGYQNGEGYYVKYTYYLKSSAEAITLNTAANGQNLNIKEIRVSGGSTATEQNKAPNLNKALRVAIVLGGKAYIFAPVDGATSTYYVNASNTATTVLSGQQPTALTELPATTANGTPVDIYLYFEGEDANLMTDNIGTTLDTLTLEVDFALVSNGENAVTDRGVSVGA